MRPPEDVYQGELVRYPGPWGFNIPRSHIILVSDEQLEQLQDPDALVDLSLSPTKDLRSLRQVCEQAAARGVRTLMFAFDHFWNQYREGQGNKPRELLPDTDEYISRIAKVSHFVQQYGIGLELSLLSPLELGKGFRNATGETGKWMHVREGIRDPSTGAFFVQLWRQKRWGNNKGAFDVELENVRAFAFRERQIGGTHLFSVVRDEIREITDCVEMDPGCSGMYSAGDYLAERVAVRGNGMADVGDLDRVAVVLTYKTPEMDYFSPSATAFLQDLLERYRKAGVKLNALYADEMHIQQDWGYFSHHDHGQLALRYVSPHLERRFSELFGREYADFAPWMVYFCSGQHDFLPTTGAASFCQHVLGSTQDEISATFLLRQRYYHVLEGTVVDLMTDAKHYAEQLAGHTLPARAHVTWAESPTIDDSEPSPLPHYTQLYEYTQSFRWSNTVHQAASACQDYFRWNDFLTGGGNDHAEGGYADRNYFALALACSTGNLNEVPYAYAAHWGMPKEIAQRRSALVDVFGACASPTFQAVEDSQHRTSDVLMLYPIDLVSVDERFGSWMVQYGYADYITAEKLCELGRVTAAGEIAVKDRRYRTLVALYEPFPSEQLMFLMERLVNQGGRVVWSGTPPFLHAEGTPVRQAWERLFGVTCEHEGAPTGVPVPGRTARFCGPLDGVPAQTILTNTVVDHIYPFVVSGGSEVSAKVGKWVVGAVRSAGMRGGKAVALGFRPRDDQSQSLGDEVRTWFEILVKLGSYPPSGLFGDVNDNPEYLSRTKPWLAQAFPNGAIAVAPHFRTYEEGWHGGFHRDDEADRKWLNDHPLPSNEICLEQELIHGVRLTYRGEGAVALRLNGDGDLIAFAGSACSGVTVNDRSFVFSDHPVRHLGWSPVPPEQRVPGGAVFRVWIDSDRDVSVPVPAGLPPLRWWCQGPKPGCRGVPVTVSKTDGAVHFGVHEGICRTWIFGVPE